MKKFNKEYFINLCKQSQAGLLDYLPIKLNQLGCTDVVCDEKYIFSHGNVPVMLVAHLDTVHKQAVKNVVVKGEIISSPQGIGGDDRCGVFMILYVLNQLAKKDIKPYVLFTTDEEIGGVGVAKFCKDYPVNECDIKFLIEFDRANAHDMVFYDCDTTEWKNYVGQQTGLVEALGSYTDICDIMDTWKICGVNISCGYYNAHTTKEYVKFDEMISNAKLVIDWLMREKFENTFVYESSWAGWGSKWSSYGYGWDDFDDDDTTLEYIVGNSGNRWFMCEDCGALISEDEANNTLAEFGIALCGSCGDYYGGYIDSHEALSRPYKTYDEEDGVGIEDFYR